MATFERCGFRFPVMARDLPLLQNVQIGSYSMGTEVIPGDKADRA